MRWEYSTRATAYSRNVNNPSVRWGRTDAVERLRCEIHALWLLRTAVRDGSVLFRQAVDAYDNNLAHAATDATMEDVAFDFWVLGRADAWIMDAHIARACATSSVSGLRCGMDLPGPAPTFRTGCSGPGMSYVKKRILAGPCNRRMPAHRSRLGVTRRILRAASLTRPGQRSAGTTRQMLASLACSQR